MMRRFLLAGMTLAICASAGCSEIEPDYANPLSAEELAERDAANKARDATDNRL